CEKTADTVVDALDRRQVVLHVALVLPSRQGLAGQGGRLAIRGPRYGSRLLGQPARALRVGEVRRWLELQIAAREIVRDALLVFVERVGSRRVRVPERFRLRDPALRKLGAVRRVRLPRPMR